MRRCVRETVSPALPADRLRQAHTLYPFSSASWAEVVPVLLSPTTDFVPTFVTAFALDGVVQPHVRADLHRDLRWPRGAARPTRPSGRRRAGRSRSSRRSSPRCPSEVIEPALTASPRPAAPVHHSPARSPAWPPPASFAHLALTASLPHPSRSIIPHSGRLGQPSAGGPPSGWVREQIE